MLKEEVLDRLDTFKGRVVEVFCDNNNILYSGIKGHWLFTDDVGLWEIRKNAPSPTPFVQGMSQEQSPYIVTYCDYDMVQFIRAYTTPKEITNIITNLTPIGEDTSIEEIKTAIYSDPIIVAHSPQGFQNDPDLYRNGNPFGQFTGSMMSTDLRGIPQSVIDQLRKNIEEENNTAGTDDGN